MSEDVKDLTEQLLKGELTPEKANEWLDKMTLPSGDMDENINAIIRELMNQINLEMKSDLNANQITAITKAFWYALHYHSPNLLAYVIKLLKLLVSKGREGRKELAGVLAATLSYNLEMQRAQNKKIEV